MPPIDPTTPTDNSLISAFPANERGHRTTVKALIEADHDGTTGRHKIPRVADATARDALFASPAGGNLCYRRDTDNLELYDETVPGWVVVLAGLTLAQIDDASADAAAQDTEADTGTYAARILPTTALGELQAQRRALSRLAVGVGAKRNAGANDVGWIALPARGQSRVLNGRFVDWNGVAGTAPGSFTKVGAPSTFETVARPTANGLGRELHCVASGAGQGGRQVVTGLRASSLYLLRAVARAASGALAITTTGGSGAVYGNALRTINSATEAVYIDVIETDATPSAIQIDMLSSGGAAEFSVAELDLLPLLEDPVGALEVPVCIPPRYAQKTSPETIAVGSWAAPTNLESDRIQAPGPGWFAKVRGYACGAPAAGSNAVCGVRLEWSQNGGAYAVLGGPVAMFSNDPDRPQTAALEHVELALTAGVTYRFRITVQPVTQSWVISPNHSTLLQLESMLVVEAHYRG